MRRVATLLLLAVSALLPAAASGGGSPSAVHTVTLRDIAFNPRVLTVRRGQSVTWRWRDPQVSHTLTPYGHPRFTGAAARLDGSRTRRFTRAGNYRYECTIHPGMTGRIVVR